jgi:hypothetical protein
MFAAINTAIARGDYAGACAHFSHRQQATIVAGSRRVGLKVSSCGDALSALIKATGLSRSQLAQAFSGGAAPKLRSVSVHDNKGTVTFINTIGGHKFTETDALVREDGQWKADRMINRKQTG